MQLQQLVVSGELPCSREEAATLAGIQQHLDETWPEDPEDTINTEDIEHEQEKDRLIRVGQGHTSLKVKVIGQGQDHSLLML